MLSLPETLMETEWSAITLMFLSWRREYGLKLLHGTVELHWLLLFMAILKVVLTICGANKLKALDVFGNYLK